MHDALTSSWSQGATSGLELLSELLELRCRLEKTPGLDLDWTVRSLIMTSSQLQSQHDSQFYPGWIRAHEHRRRGDSRVMALTPGRFMDQTSLLHMDGQQRGQNRNHLEPVSWNTISRFEQIRWNCRDSAPRDECSASANIASIVPERWRNGRVKGAEHGDFGLEILDPSGVSTQNQVFQTLLTLEARWFLTLTSGSLGAWFFGPNDQTGERRCERRAPVFPVSPEHPQGSPCL